MVELGEGKVSSKKISWNQKFHEFWNFFSGDHEYKFFVDGQWVTDPNAPTVENNAGFKASCYSVHYAPETLKMWS